MGENPWMTRINSVIQVDGGFLSMSVFAVDDVIASFPGSCTVAVHIQRNDDVVDDDADPVHTHTHTFSAKVHPDT